MVKMCSPLVTAVMTSASSISPPGWLVGENPDYLLGLIGLATIALEVWMIFEAWQLFPKAKGVLEDGALDASGIS